MHYDIRLAPNIRLAKFLSNKPISDLGRLVQLLLGCAVNCDSKQQYIEGIMSMEASLQELIMQAIQELIEHQVSWFTQFTCNLNCWNVYRKECFIF